MIDKTDKGDEYIPQLITSNTNTTKSNNTRINKYRTKELCEELLLRYGLKLMQKMIDVSLGNEVIDSRAALLLQRILPYLMPSYTAATPVNLNLPDNAKADVKVKRIELLLSKGEISADQAKAHLEVIHDRATAISCDIIDSQEKTKVNVIEKELAALKKEENKIEETKPIT